MTLVIEESALQQVQAFKVPTFNFTKYGAVAGIVANLSENAVMDEDKGYQYLTNINLNSQSLKQADRELPLRAGIHVVADVNTGRKNIYEYFIKQSVNPSVAVLKKNNHRCMHENKGFCKNYD